MRVRVTAAVLATVIGSAHAADAPLVTPLADADITYRISTPDGSVMVQRMRWNAARWRQRLDIRGVATYMVSDYKTHVMVVFDPERRTATVSGSPSAAFLAPGTPAAGMWQKTGAIQTVAGLQCAVWESQDTDRKITDFCYSDDGLLLQAVRDGKAMIVAQAASHSSVTDDVFAMPPGFKIVRSAP